MTSDEKTIDAYRDKFGELPDLWVFDTRTYRHAMRLMRQAIARDSPWASADWYTALGIEPPPDDVELSPRL